MRRKILAVLSAAIILTNVGCVLPIHSSDQTRRMQQLLFMSENLRLVEDEWERAWLLDMPQHTTPYRTHGGL